MKELNDKHRQVLEFIAAFSNEFGYAPTTKEIAASLGVYPNAVQGFLDVMERRGAIKRTPKISRSIQIIK